MLLKRPILNSSIKLLFLLVSCSTVVSIHGAEKTASFEDFKSVEELTKILNNLSLIEKYVALRNSSGDSALMMFVRNPKINRYTVTLIKALLNYGADRTLKNNNQTALDIAQLRTVSQEKIDNLNAKLKDAYKKMMDAIHSEEPEIKFNPLYNEHDKTNNDFHKTKDQKEIIDLIIKILTPIPNSIRTAAMEGGEKNIALILKYLNDGAYIDATDNNNQTLLRIATQNGKEDVIRSLLNFENIRYLELYTYVGSDIIKYHKEELIEKANPNAKDPQGFTALHIAAQENYPSIVRALLNAGADPFAKARNGQSPVTLAILMGNEEVLKMLLEGEDRSKKEVQDKFNDALDVAQKTLETTPSKKADVIQQLLKKLRQKT